MTEAAVSALKENIGIGAFIAQGVPIDMDGDGQNAALTLHEGNHPQFGKVTYQTVAEFSNAPAAAVSPRLCRGSFNLGGKRKACFRNPLEGSQDGFVQNILGKKIPYSEAGKMKSLNWSLTRRAGIGALGVLCMLILLAGQASAANIFSIANPNDQRFPDAVPRFFVLNPSTGSNTLTFNCAANCRAAILYNAECSVAATDTETSVNIDILVDETAAPPSNGDNLFCTSNGTGVLDSWVSGSTNVGATLPPGSHTVRVRGTLTNFNAGEEGWMDDISLIVITTP